MPRKKGSTSKRKGLKKSRWRYLEAVFGYLLLAGGLAYILHGIQFGELLSHVARIRWGWAAVAVAINILSYINWGLRWKWLLVPVAEVSVYDATRAVYIGQFANQLLPGASANFSGPTSSPAGFPPNS